MKDSQLGYL